MDRPEGETIYSVSWRLRRITVEYAYVSVPVAGDLVQPDEQGVNRIDVLAMTRRAVEMGRYPEVVWYREEQRVEPHPLQQAPGPGECRHPA
jgi:hypothetical protein